MVVAHESENPLSPAELIGNRIAEKRLFEARFLFHKFSAEINEELRESLQQQLSAAIFRAEKAFTRGELLEQADEFEQALQAFAEVAAIAVDFPTLERAQQRAELSLKLGPFSPVPSPDEQDSSLESETRSTQEAAENRTRYNPFPLPLKPSLQVLGVALLLIAAISFMFLFSHPSQKQNQNPIVGVDQEQKNTKKEPAGERQPPAQTSSEVQQLISLDPDHKAHQPTTIVQEEEEHQQPHDEAGLAEKEDEPASSSPAPSHTDRDLALEIKQKKNTPVDDTKPNRSDADEQLHLSPAVQKTPPPITNGEKRTDITVETSTLPVAPPAVKANIAATHSPTTDTIYIVQPGDTLESIAAKVYGDRYTWSRIVQANQEQLGAPPHLLSVGMQLHTPSQDRRKQEEEPIPLNEDGTYTVQSGDTLGTIAQKVLGSSRKWETIYQLNRDQLPTPSSLQVGQHLQIREHAPLIRNSDPVGE